jgi:hypothetical protein
MRFLASAYHTGETLLQEKSVTIQLKNMHLKKRGIIKLCTLQKPV